MTKIRNNDCKVCKQCGICCICRRIEDYTLQFYKPAFHRCPNLQYLDSITVCSVYNTPQMPKQCQGNRWTNVASSCLSAYKYNDNIEHLLWAQKHGHLAKLKIMQDIKTCNYQVLPFVIQTFVIPFLKHIPGTYATDMSWLEQWDNLPNYLNSLPIEYRIILYKEVTSTCNILYSQELPMQLTDLLATAQEPITQWLKDIKQTMWS